MPYQTLLSGLYPPSPKLGLIEGFFGKGWSWEARARYAQWLPRHGYGFYLYAPKEDGYLRKHWATPWPADQLEAPVPARPPVPGERSGLRGGA